nr:aldo/keto reductase [Candidatus Sigynarchaeota archaeon]
MKLPKIGFGTWELAPSVCKASVLKAIETGYRFIDTAQIYGNEAQVGEAIAASPVPRDDLIIATKIWITQLKPKNVLKSAAISLQKLQVKTIDILYVHWPFSLTYKAKETLRAFSQLVDEGKVSSIGVANFNPALVDEAIDVLKGYGKSLFVVQVEHHPMLQQRVMREHLQKRNVNLVAYSPLARGDVVNVPKIQQIAKKHNVTPSQVSLSWIMDHGAIPIPKATSEAHIKDNFAAQGLKLDKEDITLIDDIKVKRRKVNIPFLRPKW